MDIAVRPVPVGLLIRALKLPAALDAQAAWTAAGLEVTLPSHTLTLQPLSREVLTERFGARLVADAVCGWLVSDGRLILEAAGGGTVQLVPDEQALDLAARGLLDAVQRSERERLPLAA